MSWYADSDVKDRNEFVASSYNNQAKLNRFWLKQGETKDIVFIDDARFGIHEHRFELNGKWEHYTCSGSSCVFCFYKYQRGYAEYYSILDLTPWKTKEGKDVKYTRRALGVGKKVSELLTVRRDLVGGSLFGKKFKVSRVGDKSPTSGNDFLNTPMLTPLDLKKLPEFCQPIDFKLTLKPLSKEEMERVLSPSGPQSKPYAPMSNEPDITF